MVGSCESRSIVPSTENRIVSTSVVLLAIEMASRKAVRPSVVETTDGQGRQQTSVLKRLEVQTVGPITSLTTFAGTRGFWLAIGFVANLHDNP